jgi:hypothetical protein
MTVIAQAGTPLHVHLKFFSLSFVGFIMLIFRPPFTSAPRVTPGAVLRLHLPTGQGASPSSTNHTCSQKSESSAGA